MMRWLMMVLFLIALSVAVKLEDAVILLLLVCDLAHSLLPKISAW